MIYLVWFVMAGFGCWIVYFALEGAKQLEKIKLLEEKLKASKADNAHIHEQYRLLKERIVKKAEVVEKIEKQPKKFTGAQLRIMNDRLNAQDNILERPNSEILNEVANG